MFLFQRSSEILEATLNRAVSDGKEPGDVEMIPEEKQPGDVEMIPEEKQPEDVGMRPEEDQHEEEMNQEAGGFSVVAVVDGMMVFLV